MSSRKPKGGSPAAQGRDIAQGALRLEMALAAVNLVEQTAGVIQICAECAQEIARQRTEQVRISAVAVTQIELIRSRRAILTDLLDRAFAERKENFKSLFERLDEATARGDLEGSQQVLDTIVNLAKTSPFQALRDAATAHQALLDKNTMWEF
jgi:hypothetical protein